jgi:GTPase SAR1 family protein
MFAAVYSFGQTVLGKRRNSESESEEDNNSEDHETCDEGDPDQEENDDEDDSSSEALFETPIETVPAVFDPETATLGQLMTRLIPDSEIHSANVIVVGSQSSGKTKMIISMVFHHLIENDSTITDEMGEKLLRVFRTGEKMVTRRPTKVILKKTLPGSICSISLQLNGEFAIYPEPAFDEIIDRIHSESLSRDGKAFFSELIVTIMEPGLPNITFTDLPGLITDDRSLSDVDPEEGMSIRKLVHKYMKHPSTTLVVVEPASIEDFETSHIAPLLL